MRTGFLSVVSLVVAGLSAPVVSADSFAGAYLAGRYASSQNDHIAAAQNYDRALRFDVTSAQLLNDAIVAFVLRGDFETALDWVDWIEPRETLGRVPRLLTLANSLRSGFYDETQTFLAADSAAMTPIIAGLITGWTHYGEGNVDAAISQFDTLTEEPGLGVFGAYHKALMLAALGRNEEARSILRGGDSGPLHLDARSIGVHAIVTAQAGDIPGAISIIQDTDPTGSDPLLNGLSATLEGGEAPAFTMIASAADGAAEVFRSFSELLIGEENPEAAMIYGRFAQFLKPNQPDLDLLIGEVLRRQGQYVLATEEFSKVPTDSPYFVMAELSRADALSDAESVDAAVAVLQGLERSAPDEAEVPISLGNILRFDEQFAAAEPVYTRALQKLPEGSNREWQVYYSRGITRERTDQWDLAEADFRKALELEPDQPLVLNYLGYSLVEQKRNLEEALEMIKTAVAARPDDGYITDSLGWAYYRLGEFDKAVEPMERAAALVATDPVINDHLGDVYWKVGREREARFQWRRALSFEPEAEEIPKIKRKLEIGLDRFLEEHAEAEDVSSN
ncbi:MAG: tetratricopeptide repeat protein [Pseudomonadota bacterium]